MRITPNTQTIGQLFFTNNEQFFVPPYQRRYAWGMKQLDAFFNDISNLGDNEVHLLGTVIFLTESHIAGVNKLELVDGQQRITSLSLLLKVIKDELKKNNVNEHNEIENFLNCKTADHIKANKVALGDLDNSDYVKIMLDSSIGDIENKNLLGAVQYLKEKISSLEDGLSEFYNKLKNRVIIIRLDIAEAKDAYKLFESINNRGLKLTVTDTIKNFILGHASIINDETLSVVKDNWTEVIVNLDGIDSDKFFRHFMMGKLKAKIPNSKLADQFKHYYYINIKEAEKLSDYKAHLNLVERVKNDESQIENDEENDIATNNEENYVDEKIDLISFSKILKNNSKTYAQIKNKKFKNKKINELLTDLERIEATPTLTFLLNLFQRKIEDGVVEEILKVLQTFMLRRHICNEQTSILDDIFAKLVTIDDADILENIKNKLREYLPNEDEFIEKFIKADFKGLENRAKYILEQFEYYLIGNQNEYKLQSGNEVHLEHIIPLTIDTKKAIKEFGNWPQYLGNRSLEKHKDFVWKIGNLTILAQKLNIVASNNPYENKLNEYEKSNIKLNKILVDSYKNFRFDEVKQRAESLANLAVKIWKF